VLGLAAPLPAVLALGASIATWQALLGIVTQQVSRHAGYRDGIRDVTVPQAAVMTQQTLQPVRLAGYHDTLAVTTCPPRWVLPPRGG